MPNVYTSEKNKEGHLLAFIFLGASLCHILKVKNIRGISCMGIF